MAPRRKQPGDQTLVAPSWGGLGLRRALAVLAAVYLAAVWLDAAGTGVPDAILPLPVRFFVQEAALFPRAAENVIDWRVEGWSCAKQQFEEIDVRPFFPIRRNDKENRFYRAMFFYDRQPRVLKSLDEYITREQNRANPGARIGGVMLLSLRIPIPRLGTPEPRYERRPLTDYPKTVERRYWYVTGAPDRTRRCEETP